MDRKNQRTIESVLDLETGQEIRASDFFQYSESTIFKRRRKQEKAIQDKDNQNAFVCYYCKQIIKVKGQPIEKLRKTILYFAHYRDSLECPIKTDSKYSKEEILRIKYNGAKESEKHKNLKQSIVVGLEENEKKKKGVSDIEVEAVFRNRAISKEWKKPDVQCEYLGKRLVFELQLSTTFLSVIVQREEFYKEQKCFILWVFGSLHFATELQKFTQKDIIYSNNNNAFVITEESQLLSLEKNDLILLCHYQEPEIINDNIFFYWKSEFVCLSDLTYDAETYKVYYFDSDKALIQKEKELKDELERRKLEMIEKERQDTAIRIKEYREKERQKEERQDAEREAEKKKIEIQKKEVERKKLELKYKEETDSIFILIEEWRVDDFRFDKEPLQKKLDLLSNDVAKKLNERLKALYSPIDPFWCFLLKTPQASSSIFLLQHPKIDIEGNIRNGNDNSAFKHLCLSNSSHDEIGRLFLNFLKKGYNFEAHQDGKWIINRVENYRSLSTLDLEKTVVMKYIWQLRTYERVKKFLKIENSILQLLSFKINRILGSNFNKLIQVANNFMEYRKDFVHLLLKMLNDRDVEDVLKRESFQNKLKKFNQLNQAPNHYYDDIIKIIMPNLMVNQYEPFSN